MAKHRRQGDLNDDGIEWPPVDLDGLDDDPVNRWFDSEQ